MGRTKDKIITLVITAVLIKMLGMVLLCDASWTFQKPLFNYSDHTEVINNVIQFNDITRNQNLSGKTFAFGNSQVRSIFREERNFEDSPFNWSYVGGFRLSALPYYIDNIVSAKPEHVMFYLSDKDFNYTVLFHSLFHHPFSLLEYLKNGPAIIKHTEHSRTELAQFAFGEIITPLKFSYQFKHFIKDRFFLFKKRPKALEKKASLDSDTKIEHKKPQLKKAEKPKPQAPAQIKKPLAPSSLKGINGLLKQRNLKTDPLLVDYNYGLLENAIHKLINNNIKIIFVEGQYHPMAFDAPEFAQEDPHRLLNGLAAKHKEIVVIKLESQIKLTSEDYTDHIHFTRDAGNRLKESIFEALESVD